jgi:hypothetical protein
MRRYPIPLLQKKRNVFSAKAKAVCGVFGRVMVRIPTNNRIFLTGLLISADQPTPHTAFAFASL